MKTALVTTTINVPEVLRLYRACDPDVMFFIMGDRRTPDEKVVDFLHDIPNHAYYGIDTQHKLGYASSRLIGENTIGRRSIAILEALRWGAELIVTIDDDNIPLSTDYFAQFKRAIENPFSGVGAVGGVGTWFDPGKLQFPTDGIDPVCQRGFPPGRVSWSEYRGVAGVRVGVAQGMILGDPDTSAIDRISRHPDVHQVSELLRAGLVTNPNEQWAPLNSQNLAFTRELAPCFLLPPQWKRQDDIWAGLIAQRVMRERDLHVYYGQPFVYQQRNTHNLVSDLENEMLGMKHTAEFATFLERTRLSENGSVIEHTGTIYREASGLKFMPAGVLELAGAWLSDVTKVLG